MIRIRVLCCTFAWTRVLLLLLLATADVGGGRGRESMHLAPVHVQRREEQVWA